LVKNKERLCKGLLPSNGCNLALFKFLHNFNCSTSGLFNEGGLDVVSQISRMTDVCAQLKASDVVVSLFIDAQKDQIDAAKQCGAPVIELHSCLQH
jgi:hypothetical protein